MIIICEPQCIGFEHAEVNAALIVSVKLAFPTDKILFLAEREHIIIVNKILNSHSIKINYEELKISSRNKSNVRRFRSEYVLCKTIFCFAIKYKSRRLLFCSVTSSVLISIKLLLRNYESIKCIAIPHGILETIFIPSYIPIEFPFWFRFCLIYGNLDRLTYLVLGPSIKEELIRILPNIRNNVESIHLPYFFDNNEEFTPFKNNTIRFGFFGVGNLKKGIDVFFKLAEEIQCQRANYKPEFILIGHIGNEKLKKLPNESVIIPSLNAPLIHDDFRIYAKNVDYVVFLQRSIYYRLTASGTLFDAFSYLKPIIALRNPFFEYYFEMIGDIGHLCDNYEELKDIIINMLENNKTEQYIHQRENILQGREKICLSDIGKTFYNIWRD